MASKYTRVKDKDTGHEYDVLTHKFDEDKHERVDRDGWPDSTYPRAAKPNVKSARPKSASATDTAKTSTERARSAKPTATTTDQDAAGA